MELVGIVVGYGNEQAWLSHYGLLVYSRVIGRKVSTQGSLYDADEIGLAVDVLVEVCCILRVKFEDESCPCDCPIIEGKEMGEDSKLEVDS